MHIVNTSSLPSTLVAARVAQSSPQLYTKTVYSQPRQASNAEVERACRVKRARTLTVCQAQATGSPTREKPVQAQPSAQETDVVVIGSGIGGLCCAALLAKYGLKVFRDQQRFRQQHGQPYMSPYIPATLALCMPRCQIAQPLPL